MTNETTTPEPDEKDDVEGHGHTHAATIDEDDVDGHVHKFAGATPIDEDDVEGHVHRGISDSLDDPFGRPKI